MATNTELVWKPSSEVEADPLWTFRDVSQHLGVPVPSLRRWRMEGRGPQGILMGKHVRFRRSTVLQWVEDQEREQAVAG